MKRNRALYLLLTLALVVISIHTLSRISTRASSKIAKQVKLQASLSETVSVKAAGRGGPFLNLSDGRELVTAYEGVEHAALALEQNQASAMSLASEDFDEDGTKDLVCGYAGPAGGIVTLYRGNVDAIFPNSRAARMRRERGEFTDAPFLSPAFVFELPMAAEFLGAGDFDADGHRDVVAASSEGESLYLMRGDGRGGLGVAERINLPGRVTAMVVGDMNRSDGLPDIAVAVIGFDGPQALVFEGPNGALTREPETFALPAEATGLVIGQLNESGEYDLAIAAGSELLIVEGRDRKLSSDAESRAGVEPATINRQSFSFNIAALATGDFVSDEERESDLAVMSEDGRMRQC